MHPDTKHVEFVISQDYYICVALFIYHRVHEIKLIRLILHNVLVKKYKLT
jgi:hypothetical protein